MLPSRAARRNVRITYDEIGRAVIDRLLDLGRDDALRAAQVEAFASETQQLRDRVKELEETAEESRQRETDLRIRLKAAEEALDRAEENMRKAMGPARPSGEPQQVDDDDARAVLDILRSARG